MILSTIYLVAEDQLGLAIGRKLIAGEKSLTIYREENGHGFGVLKRKTPNFQKMGRHMPVLMLTDLDKWPCASTLIEEWLGEQPNSGFLFRVCVRTVEAWLMADRAAVADLLRIPEANIPLQPDMLPNPKAQLIQLAKRAPKRVRSALSPIGTATIGPEYNEMLSDFVEKKWNPIVAAKVSPSLARTSLRLNQLVNRISRQTVKR